MERRRLGRTDMLVSVLGFGGSEIGYQRVSRRTVGRLLGGALDAGLNVIDTAECYEDSEELIGGALAAPPPQVFLLPPTRPRRRRGTWASSQSAHWRTRPGDPRASRRSLTTRRTGPVCAPSTIRSSGTRRRRARPPRFASRSPWRASTRPSWARRSRSAGRRTPPIS